MNRLKMRGLLLEVFEGGWRRGEEAEFKGLIVDWKKEGNAYIDIILDRLTKGKEDEI